MIAFVALPAAFTQRDLRQFIRNPCNVCNCLTHGRLPPNLPPAEPGPQHHRGDQAAGPAHQVYPAAAGQVHRAQSALAGRVGKPLKELKCSEV